MTIIKARIESMNKKLNTLNLKGLELVVGYEITTNTFDEITTYGVKVSTYNPATGLKLTAVVDQYERTEKSMIEWLSNGRRSSMKMNKALLTIVGQHFKPVEKELDSIEKLNKEIEKKEEELAELIAKRDSLLVDENEAESILSTIKKPTKVTQETSELLQEEGDLEEFDIIYMGFDLETGGLDDEGYYVVPFSKNDLAAFEEWYEAADEEERVNCSGIEGDLGVGSWLMLKDI